MGPVKLQDIEVLNFYNSLDPKRDFAYSHPPADEAVYYLVNGTGKSRGTRPPLEFKLVENYIDLGLAIERGQWDRAWQIYRYLKRMLDY